MNIRVFLSMLFLSSVSLAGTSDSCQHRIIYLPQIHADHYSGMLEFKKSNFETAARSQFEVARFLMGNKNPVFSEFVSTAQSARRSNASFNKVAGFTKSQFPAGLPAKYEDLNGLQKRTLIARGGDAVSSILKDQSKTESIQIPRLYIGGLKHPISAREVELVDTSRRKAALDQINEYFKKNPKQRDVVLVYDATQAASLRSHSDKFPSHCILAPNENYQPVPVPQPKELMISTRR